MAYNLVAFGENSFPLNFAEGQNGNRVGTARVLDTITQVAGGYLDRQPALFPPYPQKQQLPYEDNLINGSGLSDSWETWAALVGTADWLYREDSYGRGQRIWARLLELSPLPRGNGKLQPIRFLFEIVAPAWGKAYGHASDELTLIEQAAYSSNGTRTASGEIFGTSHIYDAVFRFNFFGVWNNVGLDVKIYSGDLISHWVIDGVNESSNRDIYLTIQNSTVVAERYLTGGGSQIADLDCWPSMTFGSQHNHPYLLLIAPNTEVDVTVVDSSGTDWRSFSLEMRQAYK